MKRKPPRGGSRGKGYEREVAKLFSLWVTCGESDKVFWRTFGSGGRFSRGEASKHACGDLCAEDPVGQPLVDCFSIEVKRYDKLDLFDLIGPWKKKKKVAVNDIKHFWQQCADDAEKAKKNPWLIMKRNYYEPYTMLSLSFMNATKNQFPYITWQGNFVCHLHDFLEATSPELLISVAKNFGI